MFGRIAGEEAAESARTAKAGPTDVVMRQADDRMAELVAMLGVASGDRVATLRDAMTQTMEDGVGIYRRENTMRQASDGIAGLRDRYRRGVKLDDKGRAFNTEWLTAIELGYMLEVAEAMAQSALHRKESRGAHQRLDGYEARDDENYLKHTLAVRQGDGEPRIGYRDVTITHSPPRTRVYGGAGNKVVLT